MSESKAWLYVVFKQVLVSGQFRKYSYLLLVFDKSHQLKSNVFIRSHCSITYRLMLQIPHLHHRLRAFLRFIFDMPGTFPGNEKLAHLWGNYAHWFVVLIDLVAQFLRAQTVWSVLSAPLSGVGCAVIF